MIEERVILRRTKRERQKERLKSKFNRYSLNLFSKGTIFSVFDAISTNQMIFSRQISNIKKLYPKNSNASPPIRLIENIFLWELIL